MVATDGGLGSVVDDVDGRIGADGGADDGGAGGVDGGADGGAGGDGGAGANVVLF